MNNAKTNCKPSIADIISNLSHRGLSDTEYNANIDLLESRGREDLYSVALSMMITMVSGTEYALNKILKKLKWEMRFQPK